MSAHPPDDADSRRLKRLAQYFLTTEARSRTEVAVFVAKLAELGPVVAIGGFLRDLLLSGNRDFRSDVDFVVHPGSLPAFDAFVSQLGAGTNRFGGFGVCLTSWKVDVWPLQRTWAAVNGHVAVNTLDDLVNATFFDWDAILYSTDTRTIITCPDYFRRVRDRVIDVNLEPNPNPLGNAVRALRYVYRWDAAVGERLAAHIVRHVRDHGWDALVASERRSFRNPVLPMLDGERVAALLEGHIGRGPVRLNIAPVQRDLPLSGGGTDASGDTGCIGGESVVMPEDTGAGCRAG